jgi:hypothetical protein
VQGGRGTGYCGREGVFGMFASSKFDGSKHVGVFKCFNANFKINTIYNSEIVGV